MKIITLMARIVWGKKVDKRRENFKNEPNGNME